MQLINQLKKQIKHCLRCGYEWLSRIKKEPVVCARCKSPYWNIPRKNKKGK